MKKLLVVLLMFSLFFAVGCSSKEEKTFNFTTKDLENRITDALKQMGDKTNLKIMSVDKTDDKKPVIVLSENIMIVVEEKEGNVASATLGSPTDALFAENEDLMFSFLLLVGTVDDSLTAGERSAVINELGLKEANLMKHNKTYYNNNIEYVYKGDKEYFLLRAKPE